MSCHCDESGPLCGYCDDDLYCPQCGGSVFELTSENEPSTRSVASKAPGELWTYAFVHEDDRGHECRIQFSFSSLDARRRPVRRRLRLDLAQCSCDADIHPFTGRLLALSETEEASVYALEVESRVLVNRGDDWMLDIPERGRSTTLKLDGDCGALTIALKAFPPPVFSITVEGEGVIDRGEGGWDLGLEGRQRLALTIRPLNCEMAVDPTLEPTGVLFPLDESFVDLEHPEAPADRRLSPDRPWKFQTAFDATGWEEGDEHLLGFAPVWAALPDNALDGAIRFRRRAQGVLQFGDQLREWKPLSSVLLGMQVGDEFEDADPSPKLVFRNVGKAVLTLQPPQVVEPVPGLTDPPWIRIDWQRYDSKRNDFVAVPRGQSLVLDEGDRGRLSLSLDFTGERLPDPPVKLKASIEIDVEEQSRSVRLPIFFPTLDRPPILDTALAVDFGNSNSYAAYIEVGPDGERRLRSIKLGSGQDGIPSALYFRDERDPSKVLIGESAEAAGASYDLSLFRGFKRTLVTPEKLDDKLRMGLHGETTTRAVILAYLRKLLETCEKKIKRRILHVCFSHPANYGSDSRDAFNGIVAQLADQWKERHKPDRDRVRFENVDIDEAGAVCLNFVLNQNNFEAHVAPRLNDSSVRRFFVVSVDVGGGSTDLCLAEFRSDNPRYPIYTSRLFGIGGDETLGGDNFTAAVFELLRDKLLAAAFDLGRSFELAPLNEQRMVGDRTPWSNTRALWRFAETIKLCTFADSWDSATAGEVARAFRTSARLSNNRGELIYWDDAELRSRFIEAFPDEGPWLTPDQVYNHVIGCDLQGQSGYNLRTRLRKCLRKLLDYLSRAKQAGADHPLCFIVMAGAGSRAPLVGAMLGDVRESIVFPTENPPTSPKAKVASGLARFYELRQNTPGWVAGISDSSKYTHADLVWHNGATTITLVPSCSPLDAVLGEAAKTGMSLFHMFADERSRSLNVYRDAFPSPVPLGCFRLADPFEGPPDFGQDGIDELHLKDPNPELRFRLGSKEVDLYLSVGIVDSDAEYGEWKLVRPTTSQNQGESR